MVKRFQSVFALESYHRIRVRSEELPQEEHRQRVKRILDAAGEGDRKWLEEKLRWSNELTFRTRLKELSRTSRYCP
jgi:hypothetical protein